MPSAGRVGAYGIRPHKWPVRGKFMTSDFRSGAPVPCWYVLGRMQFAPTLTADNGPRHKPASVGNHFAIPHAYLARMAGVPDALIFFRALLLFQDTNRVWGFGGNPPHDNSPRHKPAPARNHFENLGHPSASTAYSGGGDFMSMASAEKQFVNSGHKPAPVGNHFANLGYPSALIGKHFTNPRRTVAPIKNPFGNLFHDHAPVEAFNEALFCDHTLIEVFNGV